MNKCTIWGHLNKKAFTLIELLAVIVILAIIALIAVPIVLNIINESKRSATEREFELIEHAAKLYVSNTLDFKINDTQLISIENIQKSNYLDTKYKNEYVLITNKKDYYYTGRRKLEKDYKDSSSIEYLLNKLYGVKIGDYVNYSANVDKEGNEISKCYESYCSWQYSYFQNRTWRVIGLEDNGGIKIINENDLTQDHSVPITLTGEAGYINGINQLNNYSSVFGYGAGALYARSITLEDLKQVSVGFDADSQAKIHESNMQYNKGLGEYETKVKMYIDNSNNLIYENLNNESTGPSNMTSDAFYYFDSDQNRFLRSNDAVKNKEYFVTNNLLAYHAYSYTNEVWYNLLYGNNTHDYWVATRRDYANPNGYNSYGMMYVKNTGMLAVTLAKLDKMANWSLKESTEAHYLRPIVVLDPKYTLFNTKKYTDSSQSNPLEIIKKDEISTKTSEYLCTPVTSSVNGKVPIGQYNYGDEYICNVDGSKNLHFFVIGTKDNKVNLIMDKNLSNSTTNWGVSTSSPTYSLSKLKELTKNWIGTETPSNYKTSNYMIDYDDYKARLLTLNEALDCGCNWAGYCPLWMKSNGGKYWTASVSGTAAIEITTFIEGRGLTDSGVGIRPVIEVKKDYMFPIKK